MAWLSKLQTHRRWIWGAWVVLLLVWTVLLIIPVPDEVRWPVVITHGPKYYLSKAAHFGVYTVLTIWAGWLQPSWRGRLVLLFSIMAHAGLTEWAQFELTELQITNRTGKVQDVVLDHFGIAVGLLLSWRWWTKEGVTRQQPLESRL